MTVETLLSIKAYDVKQRSTESQTTKTRRTKSPPGGGDRYQRVSWYRVFVGPEVTETDSGVNRRQGALNRRHPHGHRGLFQGTHSNCIFKFCVFSLHIRHVSIFIMCDYYIHRTDLADLSSFWKKMEIFTANIAISFTFHIRELKLE